MCSCVKINSRAVGSPGKVIVGKLSKNQSSAELFLKPLEQILRSVKFRLQPNPELQELPEKALIACEFDGWPDDQEHPSAIFKVSTIERTSRCCMFPLQHVVSHHFVPVSCWRSRLGRPRFD